MSDKLTDAAVEIYGAQPDRLKYLHVVLAQCGLPYREPDKDLRFYQKQNGSATLVMTPGVLLNPKTRKAELQGLPFGARPRLILLHLCTQAKLTKSPEIEVGDSMSAFMRELGMQVTGGKQGTIGRFKDQLNRLAAARMQLLFEDENKVSMVNPAPPIGQYDVWFPKDPEQRTLWPATVQLSREFFESLMGDNAMPVDPRAIRGLQQSAMALDIYCWLAHRLCRIPAGKVVTISDEALMAQFGPEYKESRKFRQVFRDTLGKVLTVYRGAKVELPFSGKLTLRYSQPPVPKLIEGKRTNP